MPTSSITLRESTLDDASFVDELTRVVMEPYVTQTWQDSADIEAYFIKNQFDLATTRIIQYNNHDVGRLSITSKDNIMSIDNIHVLPNHQGKGIGRHIINQILKDADTLSIPVILQVLEVNPAKKLYESLGFQVEKTLDHRYHLIKLPTPKRKQN